MPYKRLLLEIGMGNDLHGGDYTKAAKRAVLDAVHHASMSMVRTLELDRDSLRIDITVGVQEPDKIDPEEVKAALGAANITVTAVKGGLDILDKDVDDLAVIATAAVEVMLPRP